MTDSTQQPTAVLTDEPLFRRHDPGPGHPESPERLTAVLDALRQLDDDQPLQWLEPRAAEMDDLSRCHKESYLETARQEIAAGRSTLSTGDTSINEHSWQAAVHAAGGACRAVDVVMASGAKNVFCVMRPPGHHATPKQGMGFCIVNHAAIAARYAQAHHGLERVLIADWDVHHGNGTQDIFYADGSVFYFSTHQSPWYPGTGAPNERGRGDGEGTTLNCPFPAGAGREEIGGAFQEKLLPAADQFRPELVIISAGFDSRRADPLGQFQLTDGDFADLTGVMLGIAANYAGGRLMSILEGGYNLDGLASAAAAHCRRLQEG